MNVKPQLLHQALSRTSLLPLPKHLGYSRIRGLLRNLSQQVPMQLLSCLPEVIAYCTLLHLLLKVITLSTFFDVWVL